MKKQGWISLGLLLILGGSLLTGCLGSVWTGVSLVYDRHNVYKKISDYQLAVNVNRALSKDDVFKQPSCAIDVAVFNGDILIAGHVPTLALRQEALARVESLTGYRRLFKQLSVSHSSRNSVQDSWITTKIRAKIFSDDLINPKTFKVVTSDHIVYLMGDVEPTQAERVIRVSRDTSGVERVVKLLKYYQLSDKPEISEKMLAKKWPD